jgi:hypothetical protein
MLARIMKAARKAVHKAAYNNHIRSMK